jgi:hypothetical protein
MRQGIRNAIFGSRQSGSGRGLVGALNKVCKTSSL